MNRSKIAVQSPNDPSSRPKQEYKMAPFSSGITEVEIDYQGQHACKPETAIAQNEETIG